MPETEHTLIGPYELKELLGQGGMGRVHRARHQTSGQIVALKLLFPGTGSHAGTLVTRFRREAECAAKLTHPGLVKVLDRGTSDDVEYMAMELVTGSTIRTVVRECGRIELAVVLDWARQILSAIGYCHQFGYVHRDLKPENLMLEGQGVIRVLDLGLVHAEGMTALTTPGSLMGTPQYFPPEIILGGACDARGDLFQIGLILYECLAGHPAFSGQSIPALLTSICQQEPPELELPDSSAAKTFRQFLAHLMAKQPNDRFYSAEEALAFLDAPVDPMAAIAQDWKGVPAQFGPYTILRLLGEGGMGRVFLARRGSDDRDVALKLFQTEGGMDEDFRSRFRFEAECAQRVSHPNLVVVREFGDVNGTAFLAMDYISGQSLHNYLSSGPISPAEAIAIGQQLLGAAGACHAAGIIHRDIKPENVIRQESGRICLVDLGLAKVMNRTAITRPGSLLGTPRYLAPETIVDGSTDARADLYQIGLVVYECVTGKPAFSSLHGPTLLNNIVNTPVAPLELTGPGADLVQQFLERTLCKNPSDRVATCPDALQMLSRTPVTVGSPRPTARRRRGTTEKRSALYMRPAPSPSVPARPDTPALVRRVALLVALLGLFGLVIVRWNLPRTAIQQDRAEIRYTDEEGWCLTWPSSTPSPGWVEVTQPGGPHSLRFDESVRPQGRHEVKFHRWPETGSSLRYQLGAGNDSTGEQRPLQIDGDFRPRELYEAFGIHHLTVRYKTAAPVRGSLTVAGLSIASAETTPTQTHLLFLGGLPANHAIIARLGPSDTTSPCIIPGKTLSPADIAARFIKLVHVEIEPLSGLLGEKSNSSAARPISPKEKAEQWRNAPGWHTLDRLLADEPQLCADVQDSPDMSIHAKGTFASRWYLLKELIGLFRVRFGTTPSGFPEGRLAGNSPWTTIVRPGDQQLFAVRFGDRHSRDDPLYSSIPGKYKQVGQILFDAPSANDSVLPLNSEHDAAKGPREFEVPTPPHPLVHAYLRYRLVSRSPFEHVIIWLAADNEKPRVSVFVASLGHGTPGTVEEGTMWLDPRQLMRRKLKLVCTYQSKLSTLSHKGVALDYLSIMVRSAPDSEASPAAGLLGGNR